MKTVVKVLLALVAVFLVKTISEWGELVTHRPMAIYQADTEISVQRHIRDEAARQRELQDIDGNPIRAAR